MAIVKYRLARLDGSHLAYSYETLNECLAVPPYSGLYIQAISDDGSSVIAYIGTDEFGWQEPNKVTLTINLPKPV